MTSHLGPEKRLQLLPVETPSPATSPRPQDVRETYPDRDHRHGDNLIAALRKGEPITNLRLSVADEMERLAALTQSDAEQELGNIAAAIGSTRFMDPPDGGDVSLAEQVGRMREALEKAEAALTQSDAGPVAWEYRYRFENGSVGDWNPLTEKFIANIFGKSGFDVRIAPPRPDASAGLIEAAEITEEHAGRMAGGAQYALEDLAATLRARAADRSKS